jgi:hypothetical protein
MKKSIIMLIALSTLLLVSTVASVYATTTVSVTIGDPNNGEALTSDGHWVGNFPITVWNDSVPHQLTLAYCMNFGGTVNIGTTYTADLSSAPNTAEWKSIAYILTWHEPLGNDTIGAVNAIAIWKLLDPSVTLGLIDPTLIADAASWIVQSAGKDVVRQHDKFQWISPITGNGSSVNVLPGSSVTFTVKLTDSADVPRSGVKVLFSAVLESGGAPLSVSSPSAITNSSGFASVTVTVPADAQLGSSIQVTANTKGTYPNLYLDILHWESGKQNLIGLDTSFDLTLSTAVLVNAHLFVVPEGPLGALTAVAACGIAFVSWSKLSKRSRKPQ